MINKLYGLLVDGTAVDASMTWYKKEHSVVFPTKKSTAIKNCILQNIPSNRIHFFACELCYLVKFSMFWEQIQELDENNSYNEPQRPTGIEQNLINMYDLTCVPEACNELRTYLDDDIAKCISTPTWLDLMAAGCLQMLREVV